MADDPDRVSQDGDGHDGSGRPSLTRLWAAFPVAWKHDELFRYGLILGLLACLTILLYLGNGTTRHG